MADNALGLSCAMSQHPPLSLVTTTLQINFLSSGRQGDWITIIPEHLKVGRRLSFASGHIAAGETTCALVSASFSHVG